MSEHKAKLLGTNRDNTPCRDTVVEKVVAELRTRSDIGYEKYKATLERSDWTREERLTHALQESLDQSNYLMAELAKEQEQRKVLKAALSLLRRAQSNIWQTLRMDERNLTGKDPNFPDDAPCKPDTPMLPTTTWMNRTHELHEEMSVGIRALAAMLGDAAYDT